VKAATATHPQPDGRDLGTLYIDAGGVRAGGGFDPIVRQQIHGCLFQEMHKAFHADSGAGQVEQEVSDDLSRTMIGDLSATVGCDDGDTARIDDMLRATGFTEGIDRWMLQQPKLVGSARIALVGEGLHGPPGGPVVAQTQTAHDQDLRGVDHAIALVRVFSTTGSIERVRSSRKN